MQESQPDSAKEVVGASCSAPTPLSPSVRPNADCTPHVTTPLSDVSAASPHLAAAFGLSSASRDAVPRSSPRQRSFSYESPLMPTLPVTIGPVIQGCTMPQAYCILQEEDDSVIAAADNFSLDSPAVELFLSPAGEEKSSPVASDCSPLMNDAEMSRDESPPRDGDKIAQKTPGNSRRGKKKGAKQHRKSGGGGAF